MFTTFINWVLSLAEGLGYVGVFVLMAVESSFLPFPSELAIPPAAWLASQGKMNLLMIILFGTLGSVVGAVFNYFLALWLGRPLIYKLIDTKFAKLLRLKKEDLERTEKMFLENANKATFVARLIPVVRQLISIPAGFTKMPFTPFILLTTLGSLIWVTILAILGYTLGANQELLHVYYEELTWALLILGILWILNFFRKKRKKRLTKENRA